MPKRLKSLWPLIFPLTLAACGNALEGYSPPPEIPPIRETVVEKSFDETWRDLLFVAADNSFRIIEIDQDAGTMVLQFDSATGLVNCGTFKGRPAYMPVDGVVELAINVTRLRVLQTRIDLRTTYGRRRTVSLLNDGFFNPLVTLMWILPMYAIIGVHETCQPTHSAEHTIVDRISRRDVLGPSSPQVAAKLARWAYRYREWPQPFFDESLLMYAQILGADQTEINPLLLRYADYARRNGNLSEAETLLRRVLEVQEKALGQDHPSLVPTLEALASILGDEENSSEAEATYIRILAIREETPWELSSPYCYRPEGNSMLRVYLMECPLDTISASRAEYAEWNASKETYGVKYRRREAAE